MARMKQNRPGGPRLVGSQRRASASLADAAQRRPGGVPKRRKRRKRPGTHEIVLLYCSVDFSICE